MRAANKAAPYSVADVHALRAVALGTATEAQQKRAMDWIVRSCAEAYEPNTAPTAQGMAFCEGRRSVGLEIARLVEMPVSPAGAAALKKMEHR